jgi:hypothetical protein
VLSESSYLTAIYTYVGAAFVLLIYLAWILSRYWRNAWVAFVVLISAALLLTPANPDAQITTFAPALIVAIFEGLISGPEAAQHAIKPLTYMLTLALLLSIVLRITVFRMPQSPSGNDNE